MMKTSCQYHVCSSAYVASPQWFTSVVIIDVALSYAFGIPDSVWFGKPWSSFYKQCFDALVYGCLMGGVFGWLWT